MLTRKGKDMKTSGCFKRIMALFGAINFCVALPARADVWYVDASISVSGNGNSWATAFAKINDAITAAAGSDTVLTAPGIYRENIDYLNKNLTIASLTFTTGDTNYISQTIIDGGLLKSVVTCKNLSASAMLCGFVIRQGKSNDGGGIFCQNSNPRLKFLTIRDNLAHYGSGLYCTNSSPVVESVRFVHNESIRTYPYRGYGSGICCENQSNPVIQNCVIADNFCDTKGGGVFCSYSAPEFYNVVMQNNAAVSVGGGICCESKCAVRLVNVFIAGNLAADGGGGVYSFDSSPIIQQATIVGNIAEARFDTGDKNMAGGGLYMYKGTLTLVNSVVTDNLGDYGFYMNAGTPTIRYCNFFNNETGNFFNCGQIGVNTQVNSNGDPCDAYFNTQLDPLFVQPAMGNYRLSNWSHCIGVGIQVINVNGQTITAPIFDIENQPRPLPSGTSPDMGAFENPNGVFLPVELVNWNARVLGNDVELTWMTLSENNNVGFAVERRIPGKEFSEITFLSGYGTTVEPHSYAYFDRELDAGAYDYRLQQIDANGGRTVSATIRVTIQPFEFDLFPASPNPFNNSTRIIFHLPHTTQADLAIYNLNGCLVRLLVSAYLPVGRHEMTWSGKDEHGLDVASGCYICRLKVGDRVQIQRLMMIK